MSFGVSNRVIQRVLTGKGVIAANEIHFDDEHLPPEALGYAITNLKAYFTSDAWKGVTTASKHVFCSVNKVGYI